MRDITRAVLDAYLDDALDEGETTRVEKALRDSESLRLQLRNLITERDRGEHSLGAIWRRRRLSCPSREQLGSFLLEALEPEMHSYIEFHIRTIACPFCVANLADLHERQSEPAPAAQKRRQRFFKSSAGYLQQSKDSR